MLDLSKAKLGGAVPTQLYQTKNRLECGDVRFTEAGAALFTGVIR